MSKWQPYEPIDDDKVIRLERLANSQLTQLCQELDVEPSIDVCAEPVSVLSEDEQAEWHFLAPGIFVKDNIALSSFVSDLSGQEDNTLSPTDPVGMKLLGAFAAMLISGEIERRPDHKEPGPGIKLSIVHGGQAIQLLYSTQITRQEPAALPAPEFRRANPARWMAGESVGLSAELPATTISFAELTSLAAGDVLLLDSQALAQATLKTAQGKSVFGGRMGKINEHMGVEII